MADTAVEKDKQEQQLKRKEAWDEMQNRMRKEGKAKVSADAIREAGKGLVNFDKKTGVIGASKYKPVTDRGAGAWILALIIAFSKDLIDFSTFELLSAVDWVLDIIIGVVIGGIIFGFGSSGKRKKMKTLRVAIRRLIIPIIIEVAPGLGFLPAWTFSVLFMYIKMEMDKSSQSNN